MRQANALGELIVGDAGVGSQFPENPEVEIVGYLLLHFLSLQAISC